MARKTKMTDAQEKQIPAAGSALTKKAARAQADLAIPVVGLGASAGGVKAYSDFLEAMPADTGAAFVLVHHVDPDHKSLMADILTKRTVMPVVLAEDQSKIQANHVYIIPPKKFLEIEGGHLVLFEPIPRRGARLPIDLFFRSLAMEKAEKAIAIILSGTGSDGSAAIREIKDKGGIVLVQDPSEAEHDGMPRSAMATSAVDHVVKIAQMPEIITSYVRHISLQNGTVTEKLGEKAKGSLDQIIEVLKAHSPINFDLYKEGTLLRRIERRMALRHMENSGDYLALIKDSAVEARNLTSDLLISVTSFFRDSDALEYLEANLIDKMVQSHDSNRPVRIWVPGCATGEEAYSLAMLFIEKITERRNDVKLQIFASDVDEPALSIARNGVYPDSIAQNVSAPRLKRFFTKEDHSYRVSPELRDAVVFANQNVLSDAPFSKLDLISCRNLMIYLTPDAQERVLQMFHFALNDGGTLFLGMSETTSNQDALFEPVSKKFRIFRRIGHGHGRAFDFPVVRPLMTQATTAPARREFQAAGEKLAALCHHLLVEHYAPAAVLVNAKSEALFFDGPADDYLRVAAGEASRDLLAMARQGLRARLNSALRTARIDNAAAKETATITRGDTKANVAIQVHPVKLDGTKLFLVTFADQPATESVAAQSEMDIEVNRQLERELETTRADLRDTITDYEQTTEELKAVNEEAMSMNEEFQSTNEELETSKEELQSLNEELTTLNTQLQQKIDDERRISDDLNNLLASSGIATLFLDTNANIMRFTPATRELFNLISKDVGRPFSDITSKIKDSDLLNDVETVLETLSPAECEVESDTGKWFVRRMLPYRTQSGKIDGVAITYSDVSEFKKLQKRTDAAHQFANSIISTVRETMLVLDGTFKIVASNRSFAKMFATGSADVLGKSLFSIQNRQWDVPELRALMESIVSKDTTVEAFYLSLELGDLGTREMVLNARKIVNCPNHDECILVAVEDVTEKNATQRAALNREARLRAILDAVPEAVMTIDEKGTIGTFNPGAETIFGFEATQIIGQNVKILMPEPHKSKHDGYLKHYFDTGEKKIIGSPREMAATRKDGSGIPIRLTVSELELDGKRQFLGIIHDLTNDRKHQEELRRAQKMEAVGQLTGGLAHDFNNLLTVVTGNLELLETRISDERQRMLINEALEASNLGATLTSQLLSFSKKQSLEPKTVALNDLVKTMLPILERTLKGDVTIKIRLSDDLAMTLADPGQIESALLNLALNARDAMKEGGTLMIETSNAVLDDDYSASQIDVTPGDYVCLSVSDSGVGMSPDTKAQAFEPFFTTKGPGAGSGLGLSMVYGFAKQSGGHVAIYSEPEQGTTIKLFLPTINTSPQNGLNELAAQSDCGGGETILVVEDDPKVMRLTIARLEDLKYNVLSATDGPKAMDILKNRDDIHLVLSDIMMPGGMTGFDVAEQAQALKPDLKILLATGYAKGVTPRDTLAAKPEFKILRKPYGISDLATALRNLLDRPAP